MTDYVTPEIHTKYLVDASKARTSPFEIACAKLTAEHYGVPWPRPVTQYLAEAEGWGEEIVPSSLHRVVTLDDLPVFFGHAGWKKSYCEGMLDVTLQIEKDAPPHEKILAIFRTFPELKGISSFYLAVRGWSETQWTDALNALFPRERDDLMHLYLVLVPTSCKVSALGRLPSLRRLTLCWQGDNSVPAQYLDFLAKMPNLDQLELSRIAIDPLENRDLPVLPTVRRATLEPLVYEHIPVVSFLPNVEALKLGSTVKGVEIASLTASTAAHLATGQHLKSLICYRPELSIDWNRFRRLERLKIHKCDIPDASLDAIASMQHLRDLTLTSEQDTNYANRVLKRFTQRRPIRKLDIWDEGVMVDEKLLLRAQAANPQMEVYRFVEEVEEEF